MRKNPLPVLMGILTVLAPFGTAWAAEDAAPAAKSDLGKALAEGKLLLDARYRYEFVDQDGLARDADAHTFRTRVGYETGKFHDFSALLEVENITALGGERFNDTINGKASYPVVADPEDSSLNRLQLNYRGIPDTEMTLGRQTIALDNQRFIGNVAWRQNDQTFDAITVKNQSLNDASLFYAYASQVNRVFGTDSPAGIWDDSHIHLINASYGGFPIGKITGYGYLLDIPDSLALSSATYGIRFEGKHPLQEGLTGLLNLEYARQVDYGDNPNNVSFDYYWIEPGITFGQWTIKALYESIEGDGTNAMQFPLGTNHAFDGWVDKFLTTPANGLTDVSIGITYVAKSESPYFDGTKVILAYHDFSAEHGSADYGTEWNALIEQTYDKHYTLGVKVARYESNGLFTDTTKIIPYAQVKF